MPRPLSLQSLDPATVAIDVERAVRDRVVRLALELSPGVTVAITGDVGTTEDGPSTNIGLSVLDLVTYAQTGRAFDDRPWHEYASSMIPLHSTPLADGVAFDGVQTPDPSTPLGVVMCAAHGRDLIAAGEPLEAKHIYTLAELGKSRWSQLQSAGDVPEPCEASRPAKWSADVARQWLAARGVPGL